MKTGEKIWLAAVSAGPDSMAMLDMCLKSGLKTAAAHVNYHHRRQADEEEEYLRIFCSDHNIPLFVRNEPFVQQGNFEADARKWRYDFFAGIVKENHYEGVLVAHQEDDLLETYLMQKERNLIPSWYGLKKETMYQGIRVVRPLLNKTKKQLQEYCEDNGIRYFVDETNQDLNIVRNRIRFETVAKMTRQQRDDLLQEIEQANREKKKTENTAEGILDHHALILDQYRKESYPVRTTALRMMLDPKLQYHITLHFIEQADDIIMHHRDFMIPWHDHYIVSKENRIFLWNRMAPYADVYYAMNELKPSVHYGYRIEAGTPSVSAVTLKKEDFPVTIRSFQEGDAIRMRFGTKRVSRFFIDRKIPLFERSGWPVVLNQTGDVILVPGLGCDPSHYSPKPSFNVLQYTHPEEKY